MLFKLVKLARPVQWVKNSILLAALLFAGEITNLAKLQTAFWATAIFCLLSSVIYIYNDIVDSEKDKEHPLKRNRPIASGEISKSTAAFFLLIILVVGLWGAWYINYSFFIVSLLFIFLNFFYTLVLKNIVIVDVMTIALSFVLRAYAGAIAISVPASKWLVISTLFLALFLILGKRRHEMILLDDKAVSHRKSLDKYSPYLLDQLIGVVTASVVVIHILYSLSNEVAEKLHTEYMYITIPFVLFGIFRYLYLIHKEEKGGSPTTEAVSDIPIIIDVILFTVT